MEFSTQEVEIITRKAHKRWRQRSIEDGSVYGPERDAAKKTNPDLVKWEDLPEEEKEKNRLFVRGLSRSLSLAGFQIEH
jgi:predicted ribosome quality control (RQC) complex YloA/Tae2 family protein